MRIQNLQQLNKMKREGGISASLYQRLAAELESAEVKAKTPSRPKTMHSSKYNSTQAEQQKRAAQKEFCMLPEYIFKTSDLDPEVLLYRAAVNRWGRAYEGGEVVYQLTIRNPKSYSLDVALPRYRVAIEVDGYTHHSGLDAFKRDHDKIAQFAEIGWIVMRAGNALIKDTASLNSFLDRVESACRHRESGLWETHKFSGTRKRASFNSMLLSWERESEAPACAYTYERES